MSAGRLPPEEARREFDRLRDMFIEELTKHPAGATPPACGHLPFEGEARRGKPVRDEIREARQMRFSELKAVFSGWRVRMIVLDAANEEKIEEISLLDTVDAYAKLARYDQAEVVRFTTGTMDHEGETYPALEVTVRV